MRFSSISVGLLALLTPLTLAWSKEDREIFRVRDEIIAQEGADITFYDILDVSPGATVDEVTKAYRKKSRSLHPDKVRQQLVSERAQALKASKAGTPGVKVPKAPTESDIRKAQRLASDKQMRLGLIAEMLRGPSRDRYDHFLSNGFPVWKGTNYYYNRYRPGLGSAMVGVFIVMGGGFHYLAMYMSWKRQREFVERYIDFARKTAWGDNLGIPTPAAVRTPVDSDAGGEDDEQQQYQPRNRRERRMQEREVRREQGKKAPKKKPVSAPRSEEQPEGGPTGARKRVIAENGKVLVVDSLGDVYLEEEDEEGNVEMLLLDSTQIIKPTITDTAVFRLPAWIARVTLGRLLRSKAEEEPQTEVVVEQTVEEASDSDVPQATPSTGSDAEDFEMLEKSVDSLDKAKSTGAQGQSGAKKRKGRKR
ncbi:related to ERJ5 Endoplasmic Reticulum located J-protein [Cephalotrichum gorgonifer]|uniref:Related to ERJ5 Endoplasmic Reticulum located J-protein n=1 Tax=Cephalotrichum gorgonifer TaxID=2041049 RepID=A0AAE8SQR1_9PEZI|nr:related to ERJ5 Endoplasmic Reticulum located J-protein [Cephalotrichum gorgonifer]